MFKNLRKQSCYIKTKNSLAEVSQGVTYCISRVASKSLPNHLHSTYTLQKKERFTFSAATFRVNLVWGSAIQNVLCRFDSNFLKKILKSFTYHAVKATLHFSQVSVNFLYFSRGIKILTWFAHALIRGPRVAERGIREDLRKSSPSSEIK